MSNSEISYAPVIEKMQWSYSRVNSFDNCHYAWYLKYIKGIPGERLFFSDYGTFMHELLAAYHSCRKTKDELVTEYLTGFRDHVPQAPSQNIFNSYFQSGLSFLKNLKPFPFNTLSVEKRLEFEISGLRSVGILDYVGEEKSELYIVDHKSRNLRNRSARNRPTKYDEELDEYLRQLYIYSVPVFERFGRYPDYLCFNCFRKNLFIKEPFYTQKFEETVQWYADKVAEITQETEFGPNIDWFYCSNLCDVHSHCEYFQMTRR